MSQTPHKKIAVAVMCCDYRLHSRATRDAILNSITEALGVDDTDLAAAPGPDGILVNSKRADERAVLVKQIGVLIGAHSPEVLAIVSHQQCAGHPVDDEGHRRDTAAAAEELEHEFPAYAGKIVPFVLQHVSDSEWTLERVASLAPFQANATVGVDA